MCACSEPSGHVTDAAAPDGTTPAESLIPLVPGLVSGSRLEIVTVHIDGAPPAFVGFWDKELEVRCAFVPAEDGALRCLPEPRVDIDNVPYSRDPACSDQFHYTYFADCLSTPYMIQHERPEGVCETRSIVRRLDAIDLPLTYYHQGESCEGPFDFEPSPNSRAYIPGDVWAASSFVRARRVEQRISDRLSARVLIAEDGTARVEGLSDASLGPCTPAPDPDGNLRCFPDTFFQVRPIFQLFADSNCTDGPLASGGLFEECPAPHTVSVLLPSVGGEIARRHAHRAGPRITGMAYHRSGENCLPYQISEREGVYRIGEEITSELVPLDPTVLGDGETRLRGYAYEDAPVLLVDGSYEPFVLASGQRCEVAPFTNGGHRCVPSRFESRSDGLFRDASCMNPVLPHSGEGEPPASIYEYEEPMCGQRSPIMHAWLVGDAYEGPLWASDDLGGCTSVTPTPEFSFRTLSPLDPLSLPAVSMSH